jgi:hypothetical protein
VSDQNSSLTIRVGVSGVAAALGDVKKLAGGIAGAFSFITAEFDPSKILSSLKGVLDFGATLDKLHNRTGAAVSDLVAINGAFKRIGSSAEESAALISKMQKTIALAATGQDAAAIKSLSVLGLDPKELSQLNAEQKLLAIGRAINTVANADQRAQIATDLFGKSGAELLEVFRDGKAMDMLAQGGGKFGEVMQRNASAFHDAIFDLGQISNIGKKFWAGVLDLIPVQEISDTISDAIKSVDFVGFGQKAGALVSVVINSWKDGKFPEMLGLLVEAGFELGVDAVKKIWVTTWQSLTGATAGQIYLSLFNAVMSFGVGAAKFLINVLTEPVIYMAASFDWLGSHIKEMFLDSINFFITKWNSTIAKIPGFKIQFALLDKRGSDTFSESLADMRKFTEPLSKSATDYLTNTLQASKEALGINQTLSGVDDTRASAVSRLNALIQEQVKLRESVKTAEAAEQGQIVKAFDVKEFLAQQEIALSKDLLNIKRQLATVEGDFTKTTAEKFALRKKLLGDEIKDYQTAIDQNAALIKSGSVTPDDQLALAKKNERLSAGMAGAQDSLAKIGADPNSFRDQFASKVTDLQNMWGTTAQKMAQTFEDVFSSAVGSISSGITGLIMGTKTWGQAMMEIGTQVVESIVSSFVKMAIEWTLQHTIMAAVSELFRTTETTSTALHTGTQVAIHAEGEAAKTGATGFGVFARGALRVGETIFHGLQVALRIGAHFAGELAMTAISLAQSLIRRLGAFLEAQPYIFLAAVKAATSVADIPYVGPILAPIAAATTFAALEALAVFSDGGYTGAGGKYEVAGAVHRGEVVFSQADIARLGGVSAVEDIRTGGGVSGMGGDTKLHVHTWADENAMLKFLRENDDAKHVIVDTVNRRVRMA